MLYTLSEICREVRVALRENVPEQPLIVDGDIDAMMIDEAIAAGVEQAAADVLVNAPDALIEEGLPFCDEVVWHRMPTHQWGHLLLPDDHLRTVTFCMSDWKCPATLITTADPRYQWQKSRYPGICGNPQNPIAAEVTRPEGRVLEFFSCRLDSHPHVAYARYLPVPRLHPADHTLHLPRRLFHTFIRHLADTINT